MKPNFGKCKEHTVRKYYFNPARGKCSAFDWAHCNMTGNLFDTLEACNKRCKGARVRVCKLPAERGEGIGSLVRYFYDPNTGRCELFSYKGLKGNHNNFNTLEWCESVCGKYKATKEDCKLDKKEGRIAFGMTFGRFYYDKTKKECVWFVYQGLEGNRNNFPSRQHCLATCRDVKGAYLEKRTKEKIVECFACNALIFLMRRYFTSII